FAEARESPTKFISLLNELAKGGDEERLKQFLTYCNIPVELQPKFAPRTVTHVPDSSSREHQLHGMSERNIRYFNSLHEAVISFVERHQYRLNRHVERGTAQGIPNFAHILLTIAALLVNQIDRLVAGLEAEP